MRRTQRNNQSGMPGIRLTYRRYHTDAVHPALEVYYKGKLTTLSLNKRGIEGALRIALERRGEPEKLASYALLMQQPTRGTPNGNNL